jgi:hypothetical protein
MARLRVWSRWSEEIRNREIGDIKILFTLSYSASTTRYAELLKGIRR